MIYDQEDYYNIKNLNVYEPCDAGSYQPFLHVGEENLPRPFRSLEVEWTTSLPVTLISFNAGTERNIASLNWRTANEINFSHFEVQKSDDAKSWLKFKRVSHNSSGVYAAVDTEFNGSRTYYRLKMVDFDGSFSYSHVESVLVSGKTISGFVYPNPVSDRLHVSALSGKSIQLYNLAGQKLLEGVTSADGIDVSGLTPGIYLAVIRLSSGQQKTQRFIVKK